MKHLQLIAGLAAATALAGCSSVAPVTPVEIGAVSSVVPITTTTGKRTVSVVTTPLYTHNYTPTTAGYVVAPKVAAPVHSPVHAPVQQGVSTPMAVHANVPTPYGASNALVYNGYNGVRPFLVQSGAVWNGPSTYMLPVGAEVGTHQHVETVASDYASVGTVVSTNKVVVADHGHRHAMATDMLSIRKEPSRHAKTCAVIPRNKKASVFDCNAGWCRVTYKGTSATRAKLT